MLKVKWLFNNEIPDVDNCRCIMAGDTYSFVIERFDKKNVGRYSITAENASGRATCSAELIFEGADFNCNSLAPANTHSEVSYSKEVITESSFGDNLIKESTIVRESKTSGGNTISSETKSIETLPFVSPQSSFIPVMKDMSHMMDTRDRAIQIQADLIDRGSQIDVRRAVMVDESSQWSKSPDDEIERFNLVHESAPFVATEESRFVSSSAKNNQQSFSYTQKSCSFNNQTSHETQTTTMSGAGASGLHVNTQHTLPMQSDFSTTLIKDINQRHNHHFEPIELIINRSENAAHHHQHCAFDSNSSTTYIRECDSNHFVHRQLNRFEPVNMIIHKPVCHCRSGSLPPLISRINLKPCATHSEFDHTDTDDESSYYYYADRSSYDKENICLSKSKISTCFCNEQQLANRCCCSCKQSPSFKPVELVIDASSLSDTGKRYRDTSLPTRISKRVRMPIKHQNLITSSFIFDNNYNCDYDHDYDYENDSSINSDFISDNRAAVSSTSATVAADKRESRYKYTSFRSAENEEKQLIKQQPHTQHGVVSPRYPPMEMTFDLKAPPSIDVPLRNLTVKEGQTAKLECVVGGKH